MSNAKDVRIRLLDFAAQEGCDGEPYDTMQAAAERIGELEADITTWESENTRIINEYEARLDAVKNCKTYICEFPDIGKTGPAYRQRDVWEALEGRVWEALGQK